MYFILFQDKTDNLWYWNLHTETHQAIANGAEGYISKEDARNSLQVVRRHAPFSRIYDKAQEKWEL
jgi:uncharacterized protein YegP (UPF0339 family)